MNVSANDGLISDHRPYTIHLGIFLPLHLESLPWTAYLRVPLDPVYQNLNVKVLNMVRRGVVVSKVGSAERFFRPSHHTYHGTTIGTKKSSWSESIMYSLLGSEDSDLNEAFYETH